MTDANRKSQTAENKSAQITAVMREALFNALEDSKEVIFKHYISALTAIQQRIARGEKFDPKRANAGNSGFRVREKRRHNDREGFEKVFQQLTDGDVITFKTRSEVFYYESILKSKNLWNACINATLYVETVNRRYKKVDVPLSLDDHIAGQKLQALINTLAVINRDVFEEDAEAFVAVKKGVKESLEALITFYDECRSHSGYRWSIPSPPSNPFASSVETSTEESTEEPLPHVSQETDDKAMQTRVERANARAMKFGL